MPKMSYRKNEKLNASKTDKISTMYSYTVQDFIPRLVFHSANLHAVQL